MDKTFQPYFRYFEFGGRSTRSEFWLFHLFVMTVSIMLFVAAGGMDLFSETATDAVFEDFFMSIPFWLLIVFGIFNFIPGLALAIRRFHDAGFSGWVYLGLILVSMIPWIGFLADLAVLVISLLPSVQSNQWGENPHDGWERDSNYGYQRPEPAARPDGVRFR